MAPFGRGCRTGQIGAGRPEAATSGHTVWPLNSVHSRRASAVNPRPNRLEARPHWALRSGVTQLGAGLAALDIGSPHATATRL